MTNADLLIVIGAVATGSDEEVSVLAEDLVFSSEPMLEVSELGDLEAFQWEAVDYLVSKPWRCNKFRPRTAAWFL